MEYVGSEQFEKDTAMLNEVREKFLSEICDYFCTKTATKVWDESYNPQDLVQKEKILKQLINGAENPQSYNDVLVNATKEERDFLSQIVKILKRDDCTLYCKDCIIECVENIRKAEVNLKSLEDERAKSVEPKTIKYNMGRLNFLKVQSRL